MLNPAKATPQALLSRAKSLMAVKKYAEAERYVLETLRKDNNDAEALFLLAELNMTQEGRHQEAVTYTMLAIRADPSNLVYKEKFIEIAGGSHVHGYGDLTEFAIVECLKSQDKLDCMKMQVLWITHLLQRPDFHAAYDYTKRRDFDPGNKEFFENLTDFRPLFEPCFLLGIKIQSANTPVFEEFITHIRKHLLNDHGVGKKFTPEQNVTLSAALAQHIFNRDYIADVTDEEQKKIDALRVKIEAGETDAGNVALFSCYAPLYMLKNAAEIEKAFSTTLEMNEVVKAQITDYNALGETAATITAITPIDDSVSMKVREQYEEFPYPRWKFFSKNNAPRIWKATGRSGEVEERLAAKKMKLLIAGCGTGQEAVAMSTLFPKADILAVDLSLSSLAYAINKAREYDIKNVTFHQADILRLNTLPEKFDCIISSGVLHHLQETMKGWKILYDLLKPGGMMRIALYSKIARSNIMKAQDAVRKSGIGSDTASMKEFRRKSPQILEDAVLRNVSSFSDYYSLSMYRDLLFHVQEHNYDLTEIGAMLKELGLEFSGFLLPPQVQETYAKRFPDDPKKTNLANWHVFEQENPPTFRFMYVFWCEKPLKRI